MLRRAIKRLDSDLLLARIACYIFDHIVLYGGYQVGAVIPLAGAVGVAVHFPVFGGAVVGAGGLGDVGGGEGGQHRED